MNSLTVEISSRSHVTSFYRLFLLYKSISWFYFCNCLLGRAASFLFFYFVALSHLEGFFWVFFGVFCFVLFFFRKGQKCIIVKGRGEKKQNKTRASLHIRIHKNEFYLNHPGFIIIGSPKFNLIIHCAALE